MRKEVIMKDTYNEGDYIFAKMRVNRYWPARLRRKLQTIDSIYISMELIKGHMKTLVIY